MIRFCVFFSLFSLSAVGQIKSPQLLKAERLLTVNTQKAIIEAKVAHDLALNKADYYNTIMAGFFLSKVYSNAGSFQVSSYYDSISIRFAGAINDSLFLQKALNNYAYGVANLGDLKAAEQILRKNEKFCSIFINKETSRYYTIKSFCYFKQMKTDDAIQNSRNALSVALTLKDSTDIVRLKGLISEIYLRLIYRRDSIQLIYDAMEYLEKTNNYSYAAENASAIGFAFQKAFNSEKWMLYSKKALELSLKGKDLYQIAKMRVRLGDVYLEQKNYAAAKEFFTKSNTFYQGIKNKPGLAASSIFLGRLYTETAKYDSAKYYFNLIEQLNKDLNLVAIQVALTAYRFMLQSKLKDYKSADSLMLVGSELIKNNFDKELIKHTLEVQKKGNFFSDEEARGADSFFLSPKIASSSSKLPIPMTSKQIENISQLNIYTGSAKVLDTTYIESNNSQIYQTETQYRTRLFKDSLRVQTQQNIIDKQQLKLAEQRITARNRTLLFSAALVLLISVGLWLQFKTRKRTERDKAKIELLQNEIHHRVKNNLAVINRLVEVAGKNSVEDAPLITLKNRIKSIELLHNHLYSNEAKTGNISLQSYFEDLCLAIAATFQTAKDVQISVKAPTEVDSTIAEKLGLILNELVTNSFKYAFENQEKGAITVIAKPEGKQLNIIVQDNGIGMAAEKNTKSYGMKLIKGLSNELNGKFAFHNLGGTSFQLSIPLSA